MQVAGISDGLIEDKLDEFLPIFDEAKNFTTWAMEIIKVNLLSYIFIIKNNGVSA